VRSAALAVVGAVVLLSWVACERRDAPPGSTSAGTAAAPPAPSSPAIGEQVVELVVEGMHCATCPITVRTAARSVPGVVDVEVTMSPGRARVRYRPSETDSTRIAAAITDSGYPAHEVNK
jgi:copper chaperone CopZ